MKKVGILTNQLYSWEDTDVLSIGGGERVTIRIAELMLKLGYEVHVYQYSHNVFNKMLGNIHVHGVRSKRAIYNCFHIGVHDVFNHFTKDFDKVIICLPEMCGDNIRGDAILLTQGSLWCGCKEGSLDEKVKDHLYRSWSKAKTNITVHPYTQQAVRDLGFDDIADKMICIENFIDTDVFAPTDKEKTIIFPGRAEEAKGTNVLDEILYGLNLHDWNIVWCGQGSKFDDIKKLEKKYKNFKAVGYEMDDIHKAYASASICVVMNTLSKGNSLTLMEGMASECACIGINGGTSLINNGINGILCDIDQVSDAITVLSERPDLRTKLGTAARKHIIENYSFSKWEEKWKNIIEESDNG